ncbi:MAG: ORF6N domain-containing protein [Bacteroidaceae bacterium]|nr:ORF6N domain-containing protein [Bacteroidaceae bacterium]
MDSLEPIKRKIYEIRGQRVMLDRDLAELYHVTTGNLNKAVKRNIRRFPPDFMFQLNKEEFEKLRNDLIFQNGISNWGGTRKLPYAFTEQGLAMLSGILNSDIAIDVNINIMRAFVAIRRMAASLPKPDASADVAQLRKDFEELKLDIEEILHDQNYINESTRAQLDAISEALMELQNQGKNKSALPEIGYTAIQKRREEEM